MKRFRFKKIDAFTDGTSAGNPAACLYPEGPRDISEDEMLRIARELKGFVSEAVYLFPGDVPALRYYSSECEVDFCGHGTVAAMYGCILSRSELLDREEIIISVRGERLAVLNRLRRDNSVYIQAPAPLAGAPVPDNAAIAGALGMNDTSLHESLKARVIRCGLAALIVPVNGIAPCLTLHPDQERLKSFCLDRDIDIVVPFTGETSRSENRFRSRVFAPKFGYLEDPATGSGNSALGHYLRENSLWDGSPISIEQGPARDAPNIVKIMAAGKSIFFGGSAAVRIEGEYIL